MELLAEISDRDFGLKPKKNIQYRLRKASRSVMLDRKGRVALMHATKGGYYKLPGGGIDGDESQTKALKREMLEETGYNIKIGKPLGTVLEYRSKTGLVQMSYCFMSRPVGKQMKIGLTAYEKSEGFKLEWVAGINKAIRLVKGDRSDSYDGNFAIRRDTIFLKAADTSMRER